MAVFPDYDKSIVSLSNSLLKFFDVPPQHSGLAALDKILSGANKKNIVFMILDCLGVEILNRHLPADSFLRRHFVEKISSVFPPTTTAATTSLHSGLCPAEHGWVGWAPYFKERGRVIEIFLNRDFYTQEILTTPPVRDSLPYQTIYQRITAAHPDVEYHRVFPPFDPNGVKSFAEMCRRIPQVAAASQKRKIISAYWPYPDHDLHRQGTKSEIVRQGLLQMDAELKRMAGELSDAVLIVTADHGIVDVEESSLNDYPELLSCLALPPSLEARFVSFFIKPDKKDFFATEFKRIFGADFMLLSRQEFLDGGYLGSGKRHERIAEFIGDFVAVGITQKSLRYQSEQGTGFQHFAADHAGLTQAELDVPLIVCVKD